MFAPANVQNSSNSRFGGSHNSMYEQLSAQAKSSPNPNFGRWCESNRQQLQGSQSCSNFSSPMTITSSDANNSSIDLGTGYQAKFSTNGASMQLFNHGKLMGTISGDPHASGADGASEGSFKQNMQFKLPDGSTISTRTSDGKGGATYLEEAIVHRGDGSSIRVDGINKPGQMQTSVIPPGWGQRYADQAMLSDKGPYTADQVGVNDKGFYDPQTGKQMDDAAWAKKDQHVTQMTASDMTDKSRRTNEQDHHMGGQDRRIDEQDRRMGGPDRRMDDHDRRMDDQDARMDKLSRHMADQANLKGLALQHFAQGFHSTSDADCKRQTAGMFKRLLHLASMNIESQFDLCDSSGCKRRTTFPPMPWM